MQENNKLSAKTPSRRERAASVLRITTEIIATAAIIFAAVCFALSCVDIYKNGDDTPFTKESIAAHFELISIPTLVAVGSVILSALVALLFPKETTLGRIYNPYPALKSYKARLDLSHCDWEIALDIKSQRRHRRTARVFFFILCVLLLGAALLFSLDFSRYTATDINSEILGCVIISLPASVLGLLSLFVGEIVATSIASYELDLTKWAVTRRREALVSVEKKEKKGDSPILLGIIRVAFLSVGVTFVVLGIMNGGMNQVLGKAIAICTECIGLG